MGSSGGGGSGRAPSQPTPSGPIADFGSSTDFNPGFTNVLGAGWATPESVDAGLAAGPQYRTPPPMPSGGMGGMPMDESSLRKMLAELMGPRPNTPQQQAALRIGMRPGAQGSYAGNRGAEGGGGNRGGYSSSRS